MQLLQQQKDNETCFFILAFCCAVDDSMSSVTIDTTPDSYIYLSSKNSRLKTLEPGSCLAVASFEIKLNFKTHIQLFKIATIINRQ
jgi:hypothetical protein